MLVSVTSLTGNGLKDWILQRISAIIFASYILCILGFLLSNKNLSYKKWFYFNHLITMKIFFILAILSFVVHAWIGIWTITTDYLKCSCLRMSVQSFVFIILISQLIWGLMIVWRI